MHRISNREDDPRPLSNCGPVRGEISRRTSSAEPPASTPKKFACFSSKRKQYRFDNPLSPLNHLSCPADSPSGLVKTYLLLRPPG